MKKILIGGYYGAGNLGDEAILECMLIDFRELRSDLVFFVTSWNPTQTSNDFNVNGIHWKDLPGLIDAAQQSDLIILGGGGLFQDYWGLDTSTYLRTSYRDITSYGSIPLLAKLLGIPCMIYAVGVGPFNSNEALQHTRFAFENCQVSSLRDSNSLEILRKSGIFNDNSFPVPRVLADPVFTLTTNEDDDKFVDELLLDNQVDIEKNLIAVVLRHWVSIGDGLGWLDNIASGLNKFIIENDSFQVVLLSFQDNANSEITNDVALNKIFQKYDYQNKYHNFEGLKLTPKIAQAIIKRCDLVLGMRLHSLIMGLNAGTPIVGIPYDPKVTSLMTSSGLVNYSCNWSPTETADVAEKLGLAWKKRKIISASMRQYQNLSLNAAKENTRIALEFISDKPKSPRRFIEQFPIDQIKLISNLDNTLEIISRKNSELLSKFALSQFELEKTTKDNEITKNNLRIFSEKLEKALKEKQNLSIEIELRNKEFEKKLQERDFDLVTVRSQLNKIYSSKFWKIASIYYSIMNIFTDTFITRIASRKNNSSTPDKCLKEIIIALNSRALKGVFVVTSTLPFDEFFNQRVINLSKYLSNQGYGVIYVAWRWTPSSVLIGDKLEVRRNIFQIPFDLFLNEQISLKEINHSKKYFIVEFPHPDLFYVALQLRKHDFLLVYEIIDDWESFHENNQAKWFNPEIEKSLILNANVLTAVSPPLVNKFSNIRPDIYLLPNGYDPDLLGINNRNISKNIFSHEEINIGYFGHLTDSWFDWDFLINILDIAKIKGVNLKFHIIGYGEPDLKFLEGVDQNILFYGRVEPSELYGYVKDWDLAMIPFKAGKLAESVDPIKLYEYLFFGLPIIVSGITHLYNHPFVQFVSTEEEFLEAIGILENLAQNREENKVLVRFIADTTWQNRFELLLKYLEEDPWMFL